MLIYFVPTVIAYPQPTSVVFILTSPPFTMPSCLDQFNLPSDFTNFPMSRAKGQGIIKCILEVTRKAVEWFVGEYETADMPVRQKKELSLRKMMVSYTQKL
jgi:hypothetical protein